MNKGVLTFSQGKNLFLVVLVTFLTVLFLIPINQAAAAEGLVLSTKYPGISASAGENITFPLEIKNNSGASSVINLEVSSKPDNWNVALKGRGRIIQQIFVDAQDLTTFDLVVDIPDEVKEGEYRVRVSARSTNGYLQDYLDLKLIITDAKLGDDELTAEYSELKGPSDATFSFKVDITNNGSNEQLYSLGAQVENGWQVSFTPSYEKQQVASIPIKPGETESLKVEVKPPVSIEAGEYIIPIQAVSPASRLTENLKVIISGTYDLEFSTPTGRLNADIVAGREKKVNLEVKNTGSTDLNNINFSSNEPVDWSVTFEPKVIENLKPDESRQVTATITASDKAIAGDYLVQLTASTQEVRSTADMRVTVKTSTVWGIVGLLIILTVAFIVYKAFQKYGRR